MFRICLAIYLQQTNRLNLSVWYQDWVEGNIALFSDTQQAIRLSRVAVYSTVLTDNSPISLFLVATP